VLLSHVVVPSWFEYYWVVFYYGLVLIEVLLVITAREFIIAEEIARWYLVLLLYSPMNNSFLISFKIFCAIIFY